MAKMNQHGLQKDNSVAVEPAGTAASAGATTHEDLLAIVRQQQEQLQKLTELVYKTGNPNKIEAYERELKKFEGFAFSMKLYPSAEGDKVVTNWKMLHDFVADEGRTVDQRVKVTCHDGEEHEIELVDFSRTLKKTPKILASRLENEDGSEVSVDFQYNPETKKQYPIMKPKTDKFFATLEWEGNKYKIPNTYLNA